MTSFLTVGRLLRSKYYPTARYIYLHSVNDDTIALSKVDVDGDIAQGGEAPVRIRKQAFLPYAVPGAFDDFGTFDSLEDARAFIVNET